MHAVLLFYSASPVTRLRKEKSASTTSQGYFNRRVQSSGKCECLSHFVGTKVQPGNGLACECLSRQDQYQSGLSRGIQQPLQLRYEAISKVKHNFLVLGRPVLQILDKGVWKTGKEVTILASRRPDLVWVQDRQDPIATLMCPGRQLDQSIIPSQSPYRCGTSKCFDGELFMSIDLLEKLHQLLNLLF